MLMEKMVKPNRKYFRLPGSPKLAPPRPTSKIVVTSSVLFEEVENSSSEEPPKPVESTEKPLKLSASESEAMNLGISKGGKIKEKSEEHGVKRVANSFRKAGESSKEPKEKKEKEPKEKDKEVKMKVASKLTLNHSPSTSVRALRPRSLREKRESLELKFAKKEPIFHPLQIITPSGSTSEEEEIDDEDKFFGSTTHAPVVVHGPLGESTPNMSDESGGSSHHESPSFNFFHGHHEEGDSSKRKERLKVFSSNLFAKDKEKDPREKRK